MPKGQGHDIQAQGQLHGNMQARRKCARARVYAGAPARRRLATVGTGMVAMPRASLFNRCGIGMMLSTVMGDAVFVDLHCGSRFAGLLFHDRVHTDRGKRRPRAVKHEHGDQEQSQ